MRVRVKVGTGPITWTILNDHTLSSCGMYAEELMFYLVIGVLLDSGIQYIELSLVDGFKSPKLMKIVRKFGAFGT